MLGELKGSGSFMPVPALSLLGFMDEQMAILYQRNVCVASNVNDGYLRNQWVTAQTKLGAPMPRAGLPEIQEIPAEHHAYLERVKQNPRFQFTITKSRVGDSVVEFPWSFKLVEIDPLLAFQIHVETDRADELCGSLSAPGGAQTGKKPARRPPALQAMLPICLPEKLEEAKYAISQESNGFVVKTRSTNLRVLFAGPLGVDAAAQMNIAGIAFGVSSPLVHVMRINGRTYLRNGFHRVYGLRKAGATHVPCIFLDAANFAELGAPGGTFDRALLESDNPPTCGHFGQGRAYPVKLRDVSRIITVNWSEHILLES